MCNGPVICTSLCAFIAFDSGIFWGLWAGSGACGGGISLVCEDVSVSEYGGRSCALISGSRIGFGKGFVVSIGGPWGPFASLVSAGISVMVASRLILW
jgi:hypothetical protein